MMLVMLKEIIDAQVAARLAGATDAEVADIRRAIIDANRKESTGQEYANQWTPGIAPVPEPPRKPINQGRTTERWYDRF